MIKELILFYVMPQGGQDRQTLNILTLDKYSVRILPSGTLFMLHVVSCQNPLHSLGCMLTVKQSPW